VHKKPDGIYVTVNCLNPEVFARSPNQITEYLDTTSSANDVIARQWLYIDCDPIRPRGVSSTNSQLAAAEKLAETCKSLLREEYAFPDPVEGTSGNGYALLYAIDLPNDEQAKGLVSSVLESLNAATEQRQAPLGLPPCKIDCATHDASRVMRLLGTWNRKGHS